MVISMTHSYLMVLDLTMDLIMALTHFLITDLDLTMALTHFLA